MLGEASAEPFLQALQAYRFAEIRQFHGAGVVVDAQAMSCPGQREALGRQELVQFLPALRFGKAVQ